MQPLKENKYTNNHIKGGDAPTWLLLAKVDFWFCLHSDSPDSDFYQDFFSEDYIRKRHNCAVGFLIEVVVLNPEKTRNYKIPCLYVNLISAIYQRQMTC